MKNLTTISMRSISFGTTYITCIASTTRTKRSIQVWSMRSEYVWMQAKTRRTISNGFLLVAIKLIHTLKRLKSLAPSWKLSTLRQPTKSAIGPQDPTKERRPTKQVDHIRNLRILSYKQIISDM